jgi:glucose-1-phosphate cytidylyltransferase
VWEKELLERLAKDGEFIAYRRDGFRQPMEALREMHLLEGLWQKETASWRVE